MSVFIMCNPLVDIVIQAPAGMVKDLEAVPGSMNLVSHDIIDKIFAKRMSAVRIPGGSGANTARGLAWLNGSGGPIAQPAYLGSVGADEEGRNFDNLLAGAGVRSFLAVKKEQPTGVSVILVTPDHERTMFTFLGACRLLDISDVPLEAVRAASYVYLTGYNWDTPNQEEAAKTAAETAKKAGKKVCFDVADPFVALRYGESFREWCPGKVDILFANQDELAALTGVKGPQEAILKAAEGLAPLLVMKTGKDGCSIAREGGVIRVPGERVKAVDTTAAGDSFAAGFLFGLLLGKDIELCGKIANRTASQMVTVEGCDYSRLDREKILELLEIQ
ncbi:MAG: adenosine kinase [Spirochaetales bacterium]|jgi:fructokinase|nr:adenosine kinase [Spirochaetales bacterium]